MSNRESKVDIKQLRMLLSRAIGKRSQTDFARKSGLSIALINRMLNAENVARPNVDTLRKIADNATNDVTLRDLLAACGYDPDSYCGAEESNEKAKVRRKLPIAERERLNAEDLIYGLNELIKLRGSIPWVSLKEFFTDFSMLYAAEVLRFTAHREKKYYGSSHRGERYAHCEAVFEDAESTTSTHFIVYFMRTEGGKVVVTDVSFDLNSLREVGVFTDDNNVEIVDGSKDTITEMDSERIQNLPYIAITKKHFGAGVQARNLTSEVLKEMAYGDTYITTVSGMGLQLEEIPLEFKDFLMRHGMPAEDDEISVEEAAKIIAKVMRTETGYPFTAWIDRESRFVDNPICIMIADSAVADIDLDKIANMIYRYARELGINEFGSCYFTTFFPKNPSRYIISYHEDDEIIEESEKEWVSAKIEPPRTAGTYNVRLTDGREMRMLYIPDANIWEFNHAIWNNMVEQWSE